MRLVGDETCPLPEDPVLAATASTLNEAGYWGEVVDRDWRGLFLTDDARGMFGGRAELADYPVGGHFLGPERAEAALGWRRAVPAGHPPPGDDPVRPLHPRGHARRPRRAASAGGSAPP